MNPINYQALANVGVQQMQPYQPGKPIIEIQQEYGIEKVIKLASNENPHGPSPKAIAAANRAIKEEAFLYPDSEARLLKKALAETYHLQEEHFVLGNGSDELLNLIALVFLQPGQEIVMSQYGFIVYKLVALTHHGHLVEVPAKNWGHDLSAMADAITPNTKLIYLANPNNPTGTWFNESTLVTFLKKVSENILIILDEAYYEYMTDDEYPNSTKLLSQYPNIIITRTFSKAYGLAGLRVGYAMGHPQLIELLCRAKMPFNVNQAALAAAAAALADQDYLRYSLKCNEEGFNQLKNGLEKLGLTTITKAGNFLTVKFGENALSIFNSLMKQGIILRPLVGYGLEEFLRITVGTEAQNQQLLKELKKLLNL